MWVPEISDVYAARQTLAPVVRRTPVVRSEALDELVGARLFGKAESLQITGSFKLRGAYNKINSLSAEELSRGLVTVSAGNAALGAAHAARSLGAELVVVMPETAVPAKLAAVSRLGARIELQGVTNATEAFDRAAKLQGEHGYTFVHPFDDPYVIAGAATATWELLDDHPDLDCLVVPASGGGLLGGALVVTHALAPRLQVYGVQPTGADGIVQSLAAGRPTAPDRIRTVADGLTAPKPGDLNFELIRRHAAGIVTVDDDAILAALGLAVRELRLVLEPSAAAGLAAVLADDRFRERKVGLLLTGSNVDPALLQEVLG